MAQLFLQQRKATWSSMFLFFSLSKNENIDYLTTSSDILFFFLTLLSRSFSCWPSYPFSRILHSPKNFPLTLLIILHWKLVRFPKNVYQKIMLVMRMFFVRFRYLHVLWKVKNSRKEKKKKKITRRENIVPKQRIMAKLIIKGRSQTILWQNIISINVLASLPLLIVERIETRFIHLRSYSSYWRRAQTSIRYLVIFFAEKNYYKCL